MLLNQQDWSSSLICMGEGRALGTTSQVNGQSPTSSAKTREPAATEQSYCGNTCMYLVSTHPHLTGDLCAHTHTHTRKTELPPLPTKSSQVPCSGQRSTQTEVLPDLLGPPLRRSREQKGFCCTRQKWCGFKLLPHALLWWMTFLSRAHCVIELKQLPSWILAWAKTHPRPARKPQRPKLQSN